MEKERVILSERHHVSRHAEMRVRVFDSDHEDEHPLILSVTSSTDARGGLASGTLHLNLAPPLTRSAWERVKQAADRLFDVFEGRVPADDDRTGQ